MVILRGRKAARTKLGLPSRLNNNIPPKMVGFCLTEPFFMMKVLTTSLASDVVDFFRFFCKVVTPIPYAAQPHR